jgi:hypothetical protein
MSRKKKSFVGKIGYCDNSALGIQRPGGHYVYIRGVSGSKCDVNTVTSLEDKNGFKTGRIRQVLLGNVYSIPFKDANFTRWSGVTDNPIKGVPLSSVQDIGKKKIRQRHKFFVGKFLK